MTAYTITANPAFNSLEISFDSKPGAAVIAALKAARYRWHSVKKLWYGYGDEAAIRAAIDQADSAPDETPAEAPAVATEKAPRKADQVNAYGVRVGDIFHASWGWEETHNTFFQVVSLCGKSSVRVREVYPTMTDSTAVSCMSEDRVYKLTRDILPAAPRATFIHDQERGDIKRIQPGYGSNDCFFRVASYAVARICTGETVKAYESWYR